MANALRTAAMVYQLERRMVGDDLMKSMAPLKAQSMASLMPAMNEFSKIGSSIIAKHALATLAPTFESMRVIQEAQMRSVKLGSIADANLSSSFAAQRTLASVVAKNAFADARVGASMAQLAHSITAATALKQATIAQSAGLRSVALQSSFASQHALKNAVIAKSMSDMLKPLQTAAMVDNLSKALIAPELHRGLIAADSFRVLDLSAAAMPRPIDDLGAYREAARAEQLAELLDDSDAEIEVFDIELDPETRLYLANSIQVDVTTFLAVTAFAEIYLPEAPLATPVAGGIGVVGACLVHWGMDFVRRGGFYGRRGNR